MHPARPDNIDAISASLEAVCARLAQLRLPGAAPVLDPDLAGLLERVLADPRAHCPLLERLAGVAGGDDALREAFLAHARELGDRLPEPGDGYPPIESRDSSSSSGSSSGSGESEPPTSSDTDVEARLSDEDAEDLIHEGGWAGEDDFTHAERAEFRARARVEGLPGWFAAALSEWKKEEHESDRWWSRDETEGEALAREAEQERAEVARVLWLRLEEAQEELDVIPDDSLAPPSSAEAASSGSAEEEASGSAEDSTGVAPSGSAEEEPETKRAKLAQGLGAAPAALATLGAHGAHNEPKARLAAARDELGAALVTYCERTGVDPKIRNKAPAAPWDTTERLAWVAGDLLEQCGNNPDPEEFRIAALQCAVAIRDQLSSSASGRSDLKRKRADPEDPGEHQAGAASEGERDRLRGLAGSAEAKRVAELVRQLDEAEAKLDARDEADAQMEAARDKLADALDTYCALTDVDYETLDGARAPPLDPVERVAWEANELLDQYEESDLPDPEVYRDAAHQCAAALRERLDALISERPDMGRKRAELEALDEIRAEQRSAEPILGGPAFARLVREIGADYSDDFRIDAGGLGALQAAAEEYLVGLLDAGGRAAIHAGRTYLAPEDIQLARDLRGESL